MPQEPMLNQRIVLVSRPHGAPTAENFRLERVTLPELADGQVLLKTLYLSLDPYMRGRMSDAPSYAAPVEIDEVMTGGAVSRIEQSRNPKFEAGDLVVGSTGWQSHSISDGRNLMPVPNGLASPSMALGVLGMPGMTAYMGLMDIGQPKAGETLVVAAASGAVGSVARWRSSRACAWWVSRAGPTSAVTWWMSWALMPASITKARTSPMNWPWPVSREWIFTLKTSAARCSMPCCRCSTPRRGSRYAG